MTIRGRTGVARFTACMSWLRALGSRARGARTGFRAEGDESGAVDSVAMAVQPRVVQKRAEESTARLLRAAVELFAEKGYEDTTAVEIGVRAGYSRNMVRDRYGTKEALLEALIEHEFGDRLLPELRQERSGAGLDRVLGHLDDLRAAVVNAPDSMRAVIRLVFGTPATAELVRPLHDRLMDGFEAEMVEHLRMGEADGSVRPGLDHVREAEIYVSYGIGLCFRWVLQPDEYDFVAEIDAWRDRLERAYAASSAD